MANTVIERDVVLTATYAPLVATSMVVTATVACSPDNTGDAYYLADDGSDVVWQPGESHNLVSVDLNKVYFKGTAGDKISIKGGTWQDSNSSGPIAWSKRIIAAITGMLTAVTDFVGVTGAAKPAKTVQVGGSDGTNLITLLMKAGNTAAVGDMAAIIADPNVKAAIDALKTALQGISSRDLTTVQSQLATMQGTLMHDATTLHAAITAILGASTKDLTTLDTLIKVFTNLVDGVVKAEVISLVQHQSVPETAIDVVLDADPTSSTSAAIDIGGCTAVTIFLRADVTDGGASPSVAFTFLFSATVDGTFEAGYVVNADDGSLDASISFSADGNGRAYLPDGFRPGAMKIVATGTNTDATNTVDCDAVVVKQSN